MNYALQFLSAFQYSPPPSFRISSSPISSPAERRLAGSGASSPNPLRQNRQRFPFAADLQFLSGRTAISISCRRDLLRESDSLQFLSGRTLARRRPPIPLRLGTVLYTCRPPISLPSFPRANASGRRKRHTSKFLSANGSLYGSVSNSSPAEPPFSTKHCVATHSNSSPAEPPFRYRRPPIPLRQNRAGNFRTTLQFPLRQ